MKQTDFKLVHDILEQINEIENFLYEYNFQEFIDDNKTKYAVVKAIEIMGEAANRLSDEFIEKYKDFPVHELRGMRNQLIHGYDDIDYGIVWKVNEKDLPSLKTLLEDFISNI